MPVYPGAFPKVSKKDLTFGWLRRHRSGSSPILSMSEAVLQYPSFRQRASSIPLRLAGDGRLTRLASAGDERAYTAIYERHAQGLYRYSLSLLHNSEDASDAVQGTMMKALLALPAKRPEVPLKPWLFRITHNEAISVQRRRRTHATLDEDLAGRGPGADEEWADRDELKQLVEDLLALPERQRSALVMRELNGLGYEDICISLGTSAATAKQAVYEARVALFERAKGRELACGHVRSALSAGDRRALRGRRIDAHLRSCAGCAEFQQHMSQRTESLGALAPALPGLGALGFLKALLGGGGGTGGGGGGGGLLAGTSGGGFAVGSAAALKPAAALAVLLLASGGAPIPYSSGDAEGSPPARGNGAALVGVATPGFGNFPSFIPPSALALDPSGLLSPAVVTEGPVVPEAVAPWTDSLPLAELPTLPSAGASPDDSLAALPTLPSAGSSPADSVAPAPGASDLPSAPLESSQPTLAKPRLPNSEPKPGQETRAAKDNGRHLARGQKTIDPDQDSHAVGPYAAAPRTSPPQ